MGLFELKDDAEILFTIEDNKIVDYTVKANKAGFSIDWIGSKGFGGFYYNIKENKLDTEFMGREFCIKFMREIFNGAEVEYNEGD
jgi:hypothetical protein